MNDRSEVRKARSQPGDIRPPALFVGDHLALDFLNSRATPRGVWTEWIRDGAEFLDWLKEAGAINAELASRFREDAGHRLALDAVAQRARDLREWLRGFVGRNIGRELTAAAAAELGPLNELLAKGDTHLRVEARAEPGDAATHDRRRLRLVGVRSWTSTDQLLQPLAEAIAELVCHEDFRLVRECEGKNCVLVFLDRTKAHARRWCSMGLCGNRAKAAAHRARASRGRSSK
jgi:predicted RNA-binding Zn ribbon-like protein